MLSDQSEVVIKEAKDLLVCNLTEQAKTCQQLKEIEVSEKIVSKQVMLPGDDSPSELRVLGL